MSARRLAFLLTLSLLCVVSMGFARSGTAPFSVVYGPASAFRAERAFLLLTFAVVAALKLAIVFVAACFLSRLRFLPASTVLVPAPDFFALSCSFRC
jgi:hypothetical protein